MHLAPNITATWPAFRSHKTVRALKITGVAPYDPETKKHALLFADHDPVHVSPEWFTAKQPHMGGYLVVYEGDGYTSFSPARQFEEGYHSVAPGDPPAETLARRIYEAMRDAMQEGYSIPGQIPPGWEKSGASKMQDLARLAAWDAVKIIMAPPAPPASIGKLPLESGWEINLFPETEHFSLVHGQGLSGTLVIRHAIARAKDETDEAQRTRLAEWFDIRLAGWMAADEPGRSPNVLLARVAELEDLLTSAHLIARRNGENTHWVRWANRLADAGIGTLTAKTFSILPGDYQNGDFPFHSRPSEGFPGGNPPLTFQDRLVAEERELADRVVKLVDFLNARKFPETMTGNDVRLLEGQHIAMSEYLHILRHRMESLGLKPSGGPFIPPASANGDTESRMFGEPQNGGLFFKELLFDEGRKDAIGLAFQAADGFDSDNEKSFGRTAVLLSPEMDQSQVAAALRSLADAIEGDHLRFGENMLVGHEINATDFPDNPGKGWNPKPRAAGEVMAIIAAGAATHMASALSRDEILAAAVLFRQQRNDIRDAVLDHVGVEPKKRTVDGLEWVLAGINTAKDNAEWDRLEAKRLIESLMPAMDSPGMQSKGEAPQNVVVGSKDDGEAVPVPVAVLDRAINPDRPMVFVYRNGGAKPTHVTNSGQYDAISEVLWRDGIVPEGDANFPADCHYMQTDDGVDMTLADGTVLRAVKQWVGTPVPELEQPAVEPMDPLVLEAMLAINRRINPAWLIETGDPASPHYLTCNEEKALAGGDLSQADCYRWAGDRDKAFRFDTAEQAERALREWLHDSTGAGMKFHTWDAQEVN